MQHKIELSVARFRSRCITNATLSHTYRLKDAIFSLAIRILEASNDVLEIHAIVAYLKYLPTCCAHY